MIAKEKGYTGSTALGVAYQSVLSNITWIDNGNGSPFVQHLQRAMNQPNISSEELSIRFNLDMYETNSSKNTFTTGRITGTSFSLFLSSLIFCYTTVFFTDKTTDTISTTVTATATTTALLLPSPMSLPLPLPLPFLMLLLLQCAVPKKMATGMFTQSS